MDVATRQGSQGQMLYFLCEAIETRIMTGALQTMLKYEGTRSLAWLHDGMYVNESVCHDFTRKAIVSAAQEICIKAIKVKITRCADALQELKTCDLPTSRQTLVDQVEEAMGRLEECTADEGKRNPVDINQPLGKLKGTIFKKKR